MSIKDEIVRLRATKMIHHNWYRSAYPDVLALKIAPTEHYFRFGAAMGRNPNPRFNTDYYSSEHMGPEAESENPVLHFVRQTGKIATKERDHTRDATAQLSDLRHKLLTLGFTEPAIDDLRRMAEEAPLPHSRALALRQIALWHMDGRTPEGLHAALTEIEAARVLTENVAALAELTAMEMMCHHLLEDKVQARIVYEAAALRGETNSDAMLIRANLETEVPTRLAIINTVLEHHDITPIAVLPDEGETAGLSLYDRLTSGVGLPTVTDGPLVTVLIAGYEAAETIGTSLRSLLEQTWRNLQIIVIDDCSPDKTCEVVEKYASRDARIELVRMEQNGGAYVARNRGLELARGKYVTLHDADDWSHPHKIEFQVRYMEDHPEVMGSTTQQARSTVDMMFNRWSGAMHCLKINVSSFMFRREEMRETLGCWDTVRFAADSELIGRMRAVYGKQSVVAIPTGPLSFQRDSASSIVGDEVLGMRGFYFGVRKEYYDAQVAYHGRVEHLKYDGDVEKRPFYVPRPMHPDRVNLPTKPHFDIIIASEFRMGGGSLNSCIEEIRASVAAGLRVGLVWMFRYDLEGRKTYTAMPQVRELIDGVNVQSISFGEMATCDLLIVRYPPVLQHIQRYVPSIDAANIHVIVNQPPVSDYGPGGVKRYDLATCARNLRQMFGKDATWYPIGPNIRNALLDNHADELSAITLANDNWVNVIDVPNWMRADYRPDPRRPLRIGRHSRDNALKWPETREKLLAAYPQGGDVEVHVLGGITSLHAIMPNQPANWTVHDFGSMDPAEFLAQLDVFVYFHHRDWVESFGRTIFEAMATGVPVILPESYASVFGDSAIYATPETAIGIARDLCADPARYQTQVRHALDFVSSQYGYRMHRDRFAVLQASTVSHDVVEDALPVVACNSVLEEEPVIEATPVKKRVVVDKVALARLGHLHRIDWPAQHPSGNERQRIQFESKGLRHDMLWAPARQPHDRSRLFVLFSGRAFRDKMDPPVFQRWSWASRFPGNCLYISDPSLWLDQSLGLAWYTGTAQHDPLPTIVETVERIARMRDIAPQDIFGYGSSGGGFTALRFASLMDGAGAVAINPQVNILDYFPGLLKPWMRHCLPGFTPKELTEKFADRVSLLPHIPKLMQRRLIYAQNRMDAHHLTKHYPVFCTAAGVGTEACGTGRFRRILFEEPGGHPVAENQNVFNQILKTITADAEWK